MLDSSIKVVFEICRDEATLPFYANPGDAGMDVCAAQRVLIYPGHTVAVPTGLKLAIPNGYEIQVRPRSGISLRTPLRIPNAPGTIDSGYRDELFILITNTSEISTSLSSDQVLEIHQGGNGTYAINPGDRIAQLFINRILVIEPELAHSVQCIGSNRGGGLGSTGTK